MANKLVIIPQDLWRGLVSTDTGDPNLDFARHELDKVKRERVNASAKNLHYNQQLRRYLNLRNERENRPTRVELAKGLRMIMKRGDGNASEDEIMVEEEPRRMPPRPKQRKRPTINQRRTSDSRDRPGGSQSHGNNINIMDLEIPEDDDDLFEDAHSSPPPPEAVASSVPTPFIPNHPEEQITRGKKRKGSEREFAPKKWRMVEDTNSQSKPLRARFLKNKRRRQLQHQNPMRIPSTSRQVNEEIQPNIPPPALELRPVQRKSELNMMPKSSGKIMRKWAPYHPKMMQRKTATAIQWANQNPTTSIKASIQPQPLPSADIQQALQAPLAPLALPAPPARRQRFDPNIIRVVTTGIKKRKGEKLGEEVVPAKKSNHPALLALTVGPSRAIEGRTRKRKSSISDQQLVVKRPKSSTLALVPGPSSRQLSLSLPASQLGTRKRKAERIDQQIVKRSRKN